MQRNKLVLIYFSFIETGLSNNNDSSDISGRCALHIQFTVHINQGHFREQAQGWNGSTVRWALQREPCVYRMWWDHGHRGFAVKQWGFACLNSWMNNFDENCALGFYAIRTYSVCGVRNTAERLVWSVHGIFASRSSVNKNHVKEQLRNKLF